MLDQPISIELVLPELHEGQLVDLFNAPSFSEQRESVLTELRNRGDGLSPAAFFLAFPGCEMVCVGQQGGWHDGFEPRTVPVYSYQATDAAGDQVRSQVFI
jgi:hypothetical protein